MKQEAVNEILGVSSYFHAVYDVLDPGSDSNLPKTLEKIVSRQLISMHVFLTIKYGLYYVVCHARDCVMQEILVTL